MPQMPRWTLHLPSRVTALTWHMDRFLLASANSDGVCSIWDVTAGDRVTTLNPEVHVAVSQNLLWSSNGSRLTAMTDDGRICVWHASTGNTFITSKPPALQTMDKVAWAPDEQRLATFGGWGLGVQVWDANDGLLITTLDESRSQFIYESVWSPDGSSLASYGSDADMKYRVRVWDMLTGQAIAAYAADAAQFGRTVLSPDGKHFQTQDEEGAVLIRETTTNRLIATYLGEKTLYGMTDMKGWVSPYQGEKARYGMMKWSPDGKHLALLNINATIQIVDTVSGKLIQTFREPGRYRNMSWSPDGSRFVAFTPQMVQLWDTATGACITSINEIEFNTLETHKWSSDGLRLALTLKDGYVRVLDTVSGDSIASYHLAGETLTQITWSSSGSYLACTTGSSVVQVYGGSKAQEMRLLTTYRGGGANAPTYLAWSLDGCHLATFFSGNSSADQVVSIWEADTGHLLFTYNGHPGPIEALAWSPDGLRLASISPDKVVHIWEADSGHLLNTYARPFTTSLSSAMDDENSFRKKHLLWSPDGRRLASAFHDQVYLWDAESGRILLSYAGHTSPIEAIAWSPDGLYMASASDTVQVWDAWTGRLVTPYSGHTIRVGALAWSPDGTCLASASDDLTVQLWEASSGHGMLTYMGHAQNNIVKVWEIPIIWSLAWSPDGSHLISGFDRNKQIQIWEAGSGECVATYSGAIVGQGTAWPADGPRFRLCTDESVVRAWQVP